jgi:hypothetical protein
VRVALPLVALPLLSCGGASPGTDGARPPAPEAGAAVDAPPPDLEWGDREPIAEGIVSEEFVVPLCGAVSSSGSLAIAWSDGMRGKFEVWVAERSNDSGTWPKTRVGRSKGWSAPRPSLAFAPSGELVAAWTAPWDEPGAASFAIRGATDGRWTIAAPIDRHACGDVALSTGPIGVSAAFVRGVKRFSAKKFLGDFVHDPPLQPYDKIAVATLGEGAWSGRTIVDSTTLLEAEQPCLCGDHLLFSRNSLLAGGSAPHELVHVELRAPDRLETVARGEEFDTGPETIAILVERERVLIAFTARDGVRLRERSADAWSDPLLVLRGRFTTQPSFAATRDGVVLAAVSRPTDTIVYATRRDARWSAARSAFPAQTATLVTAATPLLLWCDGLPPIAHDGWTGRNPERFRRRILLAHAQSRR